MPDFLKCNARLAKAFAKIGDVFGAACSRDGDAEGVLDQLAHFTAGFRMNVILIYLDATRWDALEHLRGEQQDLATTQITF